MHALQPDAWRFRCILVLCYLLSTIATAGNVGAQSTGIEPNQQQGIAADYPGDQGISDDPAVIFSENFERGDISALEDRWDLVRHPQILSFSDSSPAGSFGQRSLLMSQTTEQGTGADLFKSFEKGFSQLFVRMYVKYAEDCDPIHHFGTCAGGNRPRVKYPIVSAGEPTQGDKSFWVGVEPFGRSWRWDYYTYWCEMRGSPPRGQTWGNSFIQDQQLRIKRGEWICVELMLKINDVGKPNGEMAMWIDGKPVSHLGQGFPKGKWMFDKFFPGEEGEGLIWDQKQNDRRTYRTAAGGDPFEGFRFRTHPDLNINFVWLYAYITKSRPNHTNRIWFDDVVVATRYIGPIAQP